MPSVFSISQSVNNIKFTSVNDIPKLQLWLDSSDANSVVFKPFLPNVGDQFVNIPANNGYIYTPNTFKLNFDQTVEFFVYPIGPGFTTLFVYGGGYAYGNEIFLALQADGKFVVYQSASTRFITTKIFPRNQLYHIALCLNASANTMSFYVNGTLEATGTFSTSTNNLRAVFHSAWDNVGFYNFGDSCFASNWRITSGILYTGNNITIPSIPLTSTHNTILLTFVDGSLTDSSLNNVPLTSYGLTSILLSQVFDCWKDKSDNQLSAFQPNIFSKPTYSTQEINGLNAMIFNGSNNFLSLSKAISISQRNWSHFFVYRRPTTAMFSTSLASSAMNDDACFLHWNNNHVYSNAAGGRLSNIPIPSTGVIVAGINNTPILSINNALTGFDAIWGGNKTASVDRLGSRNSDGYHSGAMCELIHTNISVPKYEIELVSNYLIDKWKTPKFPPSIRNNPIISVATVSSLNTTNGTWTLDPSGYNIQWESSVNGTTWSNISLQTSATFIPTASYASQYIRTNIIASNLIGNSNPAYSNVLQLTTINTVGPVINFTSSDSSVVSLTATPIWSTVMPITGVSHKWFSSTNGVNWTATSFVGPSADFYGFDNTYVKIATTASTAINQATVESNVIFTNNLANRVTMLALNGNATSVYGDEFLDSSNNLTITKSGSPIILDIGPFSGGTGRGMYFNGTTDTLTGPDSDLFAFGTGDATIEFWINRANNIGYQIVYSNRTVINSQDSVFLLTPNGAWQWYESGQNLQGPDSSINPGLWYHVALVRFNGTRYVYINGVLTGTPTTAENVTSRKWSIGISAGNSPLNGYVSNLRIVKGSALYTTTFTPPTVALTNVSGTSLLLNNGTLTKADNDLFLDTSSNRFHITKSGSPTLATLSPFATSKRSVYFNGSTDNLTVLNNNAFEMGSGDYTVEFWMNASANVVNAGLVFKGTYQVGATWIPGFGIRRMTDSMLRFYFNTTSSNTTEEYADANIATNLNTWYHIAMVKVGSTGYGFVNGQLVATRLNVSAISASSSGITIGNFPYSLANSPFSGYISNLRIVKGTAVYTSNFTVPTSPLTNITNTSLLLHTQPGVIDSSEKNPIIYTEGRSAATTSVKKHGTGSLYFDGSSKIYMPMSSSFAYGMNNFTIEFWINPIIISGLRVLYAQAPSGLNYFMITIDNSGNIGFTDGSNNATPRVTTTSNNLVTGTWTHVALVREGTGTNQTKIYINGSLSGVGTCSYDFNVTSGAGYNPTIGSYFHDPNHTFSGYIDGVKIRKAAVYTANFTPPSFE